MLKDKTNRQIVQCGQHLARSLPRPATADLLWGQPESTPDARLALHLKGTRHA